MGTSKHSTRFSLRLVLLIMVLALLGAACESAPDASEAPSAPEEVGSAQQDLAGPALLSIAVTPAASTVYAGVTEQLSAVGFYNDGTTANLTGSVAWTTSAASIATVSATGVATAVDHGKATITATSGKIKGKATLTVSVTMTAVSVTPAYATLHAHTSEVLKATAQYDNGTTKTVTSAVTWSSSNPAVATVSSTGNVVTWGPGIAQISATSSAASASPVVGTTTLTVDSVPVTAIALTPANKKIPAGSSVSYIATGTFGDGTKQALAPTTLTWSSSTPSVATIANGAAQAKATGTTTITVSISGSAVTASTKLTVSSAALVSITVSPSSSSIATGLSEQLTATGTYTDGSTMDLTTQAAWTSNSASATVSAGLVTAVSQGTASIKAAVGTVSATSAVKVGPAVIQSIAVTPAGASIAVGQAASLDALATLTDGSQADVTASATWTSSAPSVATVSAGTVTAVAKGTAQINVRDAGSGVSQSVSVTVTGASLTSLSITPQNASVAVSATTQLHATGTYSDGSSADITASVTWSTTSGGVFVSNVVGSVGLATGQTAGPATVMAQDPTTGATATATLNVLAPPLVSIAVSPTTVTMELGTAQNFTALGMYADGSSTDLTGSVVWASSAPSVVSFSTTTAGLAVSQAIGATTITATDSASGLVGSASATVPAPGACAPLPSGAVSWWTGNGNLLDATGSNSGTANGNVTYVPGIVGQAMYFSQGAYTSATSTDLPVGTSDRTMEGWVRTDTPYVGNVQATYFGYGQTFDFGGMSAILLDGRNDLMSFTQWGGAVSPSTPTALGVWYHIAVTISQSLASFYLNGVLVDQANLYVNTPSGTTTYLGGGFVAQFGQTPLNGAIDEVAIYSRALSANEIQSIYLAGSAGKCAPTSGPLASVTFAPPANYGPASAFRAVDIDHDGAIDIAFANPSANAVTILYGKGDGTFAAPSSLSAGAAPTSVATTDLNGDGILDLVVADYGVNGAGSGVAVLLGQGNRTYGAATIFPAPATAPGWIATGDIDGDGREDVVLSGFNSGGGPSNNEVGVLFGDGAGGFDLGSSLGFPGLTDGVSGVAVGDIDRDGYADIVYSLDGYFDGGSGAVVIYGGASRNLTRTARVIDGYVVYGVALGDMNGDGFLDIVTGDLYGNNVGGFEVDVDQAGSFGSSFVQTGPAGHPAIADWNRDGILDVFVAGGIYAGSTTGGSYAAPQATPFQADGSSTSGPSTAGVDLDNDGRVDLIGIAGGNLLVSLSTAD